MRLLRRRLILAGLGAAAGTLPETADAQRKIPVIGLLWNDSVKPSPFVAVLVNALREKGWIADRDFRVEDRASLEGYSAYDKNAAELVRAKVDIIVAWGSTAVYTVAKLTKEIPVVAIIGTDPAAGGLVASLSRPGGNVTGILTRSADLTEKRMELLKQLLPNLSSVGFVLAANINNPKVARRADAAGQALGLRMHFGEVRSADEIERVIAGLARERVGALHITPSTMLASHSARVAAAVAEHGIPAVYGEQRYNDVGALLVYSPNVQTAFVRASSYVDRILRGARPGDLAIEQTSDLELVVNLKTAKALGIKVPQSMLLRADRVIE